MFSRFFINRPIFASVISIVIILIGVVSIPLLPVSQFPQVTPPTVEVTASFTGASSEVMEQSVTTPIEEQINGVEGMIYMSSLSTDDGSMTITVTFEIGYDLDIASVDVQNRAEIARSQLPDEVIKEGLDVEKQEPFITLCMDLVSPDGRFDNLFLSNYAEIHIADSLRRIPGVGQLSMTGERKYAMRIWLDPEKMAGLDLTADDVVNAVSNQNRQVASGSIGSEPIPKGQQFRYTLNALGRLKEVDEFANIIIRADSQTAVVRIKDIGRVELGAEDYSSRASLDGLNSANMCISERAGGNSLALVDSALAEMDRLSNNFPEGMEYRINYDTTRFVRASIREVLITLVEAILLVFVVMFIFLPDARSILIPAITIPVSLIGTFALLYVLDFSINTLTLFGLVLAVGLVVDDAIVVVENVVRQMTEKNLPPRQAAVVAMQEVTAPVVATTLVLMAVFIPIAFTPGVTGQLYRQFALTIACAVGISAINALTLSPSLSAVFLRPGSESKNRIEAKVGQIFASFTERYEATIRVLVKYWYLVVGVFVILVGITLFMFKVVPTAFVPAEDQGYFIISIELPEGASLQRTQRIVDRIDSKMGQTEGVGKVLSFTALSLVDGTTSSNVATVIPILTDWSERKESRLHASAMIQAAKKDLASINQANISIFAPPAIHGLSQTGGFQFELQDFGSGSLEELEQLTQKMVEKGNASPELDGLFSGFSAKTPQLYIELNREQAMIEGVSIPDVFDTLQIFMGGLYVNEFNKFGRIYKVLVQAEGDVRKNAEDISRLYVRNRNGEMIPLSALVTVRPVVGARAIPHYNLYRSASINGAAASGYSSGQAIDAMEKLANAVLPDGYGYAWTGIAFQQNKAGNQRMIVFAMALIFVFLFLAALYESWSMPLMVILTVPLAMLGALLAQSVRGLDNDVYCQIGLIMLIGLASKNAILIIEFAKRLRADGYSIMEAAVEASRVRLRPILMTAFAFILGVIPLVMATGAGAASRHSLGTTVFGGMLAATLMSLLIVPVFFVLIERLRERFLKTNDNQHG